MQTYVRGGKGCSIPAKSLLSLSNTPAKKSQKSSRQIAVGCATLYLRLLLLYRLW